MITNAEPVPFAGSTLREYRHVCAFFTSAEEEYRVLTPFIKAGLERGERAYHVLDPEDHEGHLARLREAGIDVEERRSTGQLELRSPGETYVRKGRFDGDDMLELIQEGLRAGLARGFPLTRLVAHAECVVKDFGQAEDWVEYETRLNYVLPRYEDPVICTYECRKLGADVAMDILRTHPVVVLGGVLQVNPFYVRPDDMLRELEARRRGAESPQVA